MPQLEIDEGRHIGESQTGEDFAREKITKVVAKKQTKFQLSSS